MKCPQCQHDMVQSKSGMLCLNCGYVQKPEVLASNAEIHSTQTNASGLSKPPVVAHAIADLATPKPAPENKEDKPVDKAPEEKAEVKPVEVKPEDKPDEDKSDDDAKLNRHHKTKRARPVDAVAAEAVAAVPEKPAPLATTKPLVLTPTGADLSAPTPKVEEPKAEEPKEEPKVDPEPESKPEPEPEDKPIEAEPESAPEPKLDPMPEPEIEVKPAVPEADEPPVDDKLEIEEINPDEKAEDEDSGESEDDEKPAEEPTLEEAIKEDEPKVQPKAPWEDAPVEPAEPPKPVESSELPKPAEPKPTPPPAEPAKPAVPAASDTRPTTEAIFAPGGMPSTAQTAPEAEKPPVAPVTHPKAKTGMPIGAIVGVIAIILVVAAVAVYFLVPHSSLPFLSSAQTTSTPSPQASKEASASTKPTATPTATPAATATPTATPATAASAAVRDTQRKADLAKYVTAYKATAQNGYYLTKPPTVSVAATDPTTSQAYQIVTTTQTALGQIHYWAGGQCGGAGITPGASSTHYVSLTTMLEGGTPYCLDVK